MDEMKNFSYQNVEMHQSGGAKQVRKVIIKKGKGTKSVSHFRNGKHKKTNKKKLSSGEISLIKVGKFIPGLFKDCGCKSTFKKSGAKSTSKKSRKN